MKLSADRLIAVGGTTTASLPDAQALIGPATMIIVLPNLGVGVPHDAAYPRMIVQLLPVGLRGLHATLSGARRLDPVTRLGQRQLDELADSRAVIDDKYGLS